MGGKRDLCEGGISILFILFSFFPAILVVGKGGRKVKHLTPLRQGDIIAFFSWVQKTHSWAL